VVSPEEENLFDEVKDQGDQKNLEDMARTKRKLLYVPKDQVRPERQDY
jgi:hypothetical protein